MVLENSAGSFFDLTMASYIFKRLLQGVVVLFGVSVFVFILLYICPGDPAEMMASEMATDPTGDSWRWMRKFP